MLLSSPPLIHILQLVIQTTLQINHVAEPVPNVQTALHPVTAIICITVTHISNLIYMPEFVEGLNGRYFQVLQSLENYFVNFMKVILG